MIFATRFMETIGKTQSFHKLFDFWNYVLDSQSPQAIVPKIMDTMETVGFTNRFHEFGSSKSWTLLVEPIVSTIFLRFGLSESPLRP